MAAPIDLFPPRDGDTDWLRPMHRRLAAPSWLLSALFHVVCLGAVVLVSRSPGCRSDYRGSGGEGFREIGLYLTDASSQLEADAPQESIPSHDVPESQSAADAVDIVPNTSPLASTLPPTGGEPILGLGGPPTLSSGRNRLTSHSPAEDAGAAPSATGRAALGGMTSMFGIADAGRRFVYVLDHSGSMDDYGALKVAKAELMSSLERLDATQQFQVIFYSNAPTVLLPRSGRSDLFRGTDIHRLEVLQQLDSIRPDGGTRHWEALQSALRTNPDVIFFLTDAQDPALTADQLKDIRQRNNGGARIHCIEFGRTVNLAGTPGIPPNFLQKLAEQNDGQYQYRDVRQFR